MFEGLPVILLLLVLVDEPRGIFRTVWRAWAKTLSKACSEIGYFAVFGNVDSGKRELCIHTDRIGHLFVSQPVEKGWGII